MTKADIVNEIAKTTGVDKASVLATVEKFMEVVKAKTFIYADSAASL